MDAVVRLGSLLITVARGSIIEHMPEVRDIVELSWIAEERGRPKVGIDLYLIVPLALQEL